MLKKLSATNKNILINVLAAFVIKGGALIISVLLFPAYIRFFENEVILGVWYTILSVLHWMTLFDFGLGNGLRNKLPSAMVNNDRIQMRELISTTYIVMFFIALCIGIIGMIAIPHVDFNSILNTDANLISNNELVSCIRVVYIGIIISLVLRIITSILYAMQYSAVVSALGLASNVIILIAVILLPSKSLVENLKTMSYVNTIAINLPYVVITLFLFIKKLRDCIPSINFFRKDKIRDILSIGMSLIWLSLVFMVVSSTNEFLISSFTGPENVVQYQTYYKIMHTGAMLITLALAPIWSAVTKAQAQKDYNWIRKVYKVFLFATVGCLLIELLIVPFMQIIIDIWLGKNYIEVNWAYGIAFAISATIFILHNVNISVGNGLSYFKLQLILMSLAAIAYIPLSYVMVNIMNSWIGIVWSGIIVLLPYEISAPICTMKLLKRKAS